MLHSYKVYLKEILIIFLWDNLRYSIKFLFHNHSVYILFITMQKDILTSVSLNILKLACHTLKKLVSCSLHSIVSRSSSTFRYYPVNILTWIFNITCFTVHTVLSIYL